MFKKLKKKRLIYHYRGCACIKYDSTTNDIIFIIYQTQLVTLVVAKNVVKFIVIKFIKMSDNRDISLLLKVTIYFYFEKVRKVRKSDVLKSYHFCYNYPMWQIVISCLSLLHEPTAFSLLLI